MQSGQTTYNVSITADLHLTKETWPNTAVINGSVFLIGNSGSGRDGRLLDYNNIVFAIEVLEGATFGQTDLMITGLPWDARKTDLTSGQPNCESCPFLYPAVAVYGNANLIDTNVAYEMEPTALNVTCPQWQELLVNNKEFINDYQVLRSADGHNLTLASADAPAPALDKGLVLNGHGGTQTFNQWLYGSVAIYCYETPEDRPSTFNSPVALDQVVERSGGISAPASSPSSPSAGAIAGAVVGATAGAVLLAVLGFFVLRRLRQRKTVEAQKKALNADLLAETSTASSITGSKGTTQSSASTDHRPYGSNPLTHFQAAAQASSTSSYTSRVGSSLDDSRDDGHSSVGQLGGSPANMDIDRCSMQFDWHIQPHRLSICGGLEARPIGVGAYGVVYEGVLDGFKPVAVKLLHPASRPINHHTTARFMGEVDLLRACRDRNVVDFKGAWVQRDLVYMVTELMDRDLWRAVADEQVSIRSTPGASRTLGWYGRGSSIALDVLQGLHYLHSNNVVHLDIKSGNILLSHDGTAKIADVGLARTMSKSTLADHQREGTLAWQSPEMLMGAPASFSADMWSFGVILLEIVCGQMPQRGQYPTPECPRECPQAVADLIKQCMAPEPASRPTAIEAIQILGAHTDARHLRKASFNNSKTSSSVSGMTTNVGTAQIENDS
ncbi:hypothetical protein WJX73_000459 [Symbiochloris irregularis]|uniref:Protein kinase domain-containing protein n=1 Tax=Symbiochloris irregularis TaxID=706552 RepID=A0AAW1NQP8_9CHLO